MRYGDVVFVVGADEFASLPLLARSRTACSSAVRLGVATRPGYPRDHLDPVLAALERPDRVELFAIPALPVSSTELRDRVYGAASRIDDLVPAPVAALIDELGLYRS